MEFDGPPYSIESLLLIISPVEPIEKNSDPMFFEGPSHESGDPLKEDDSPFGHCVFKIAGLIGDCQGT